MRSSCSVPRRLLISSHVITTEPFKERQVFVPWPSWEAAAQRGSVTCPRTHSCCRWDQGGIPGGLAQHLCKALDQSCRRSSLEKEGSPGLSTSGTAAPFCGAAKPPGDPREPHVLLGRPWARDLEHAGHPGAPTGTLGSLTHCYVLWGSDAGLRPLLKSGLLVKLPPSRVKRNPLSERKLLNHLRHSLNADPQACLSTARSDCLWTGRRKLHFHKLLPGVICVCPKV